MRSVDTDPWQLNSLFVLLHGLNLPEGQLKILHKNKKGQASEKGKKTALTSLHIS